MGALQIEPSSYCDFPANINRYMLRVVEMDLVSDKENAFVYSKLGHFIIFGFIYIANPKEWVNTIIHVKHGNIKPGTFTLPFKVWEYIKNRAKNYERIQNNLSIEQKKIIYTTYSNNFNRIINSETFYALVKDLLNVKE